MATTTLPAGGHEVVEHSPYHALLLVNATNDSLRAVELAQQFHCVVEANDDAAAEASLRSLLPTQGRRRTVTIVVEHAGDDAAAEPYHALRAIVARLRKACTHAFIAVWAAQAVEDPCLRIEAFAAGANMVTCYAAHLAEVYRSIQGITLSGSIVCDYCAHPHLSPTDYWTHQPLFHIFTGNKPATCQVCAADVDNLAVHLHEEHGPHGPQREPRIPVGACVVVRRRKDNKFLMIQEVAGMGFWLPGGGLDQGETLRAGAVRETLEEAGVHVTLTSLLQVDHGLAGDGSLKWRLLTFYGECVDDGEQAAVQPKTVPDYESAGTCWVSVDELDRIPHRDPELACKWYPHIAKGGALPPLAIPDNVKHLFEGEHYLEF